MEFSPRRSWLHRKLNRNRKLYRNQRSAVILAACLGLAASALQAQEPLPQYGRKTPVDKGPRAVGLVQLSPKGNKGRLIPIVIMMDGKFYDAASYKASPVPMALDFDTVYEAFRSGVSQGIFTVTQPGQLNHTWIAEGSWLPAGMRAPEKSKKYSAPVIEDKEGPPVLHRRDSKPDSDSGSDSKDKDKNKDTDKNSDKDKGKDKDKDDAAPVLHRRSDSDNNSGSDTNTKDTGKDQQKPATAAASPAAAPPAIPPADTAKAAAPQASAKASASDENIADPNRPKLRRGPPDPSSHHEPFTKFDDLADTAPGAGSSGAAKADAKTAKDSLASSPPVVLIPAISDAGGPDPRPYTYDLKPAEEAIYRNKMLDLATAQLNAQTNSAAASQSAAKKTSASNPAGKSVAKSSSKTATKPSQPAFDDVKLRVFDLSNSNEPVLVLSAQTDLTSTRGADGGVPQEITLIARTNLEGELRKIFFSKTDSRHLDATPRLELIDAVDADGDGRGELLFRRTFDDGSAYAIYRVTPDRLWPLFEGTP